MRKFFNEFFADYSEPNGDGKSAGLSASGGKVFKEFKVIRVFKDFNDLNRPSRP